MIRRFPAGIAAAAVVMICFQPAARADIMARPDTSEPITMTTQHEEWTRLLSLYVHPSEDGVNRFDYTALAASDPDTARLDAYIEDVCALDFDKLSDDDAFAAWANLYNALTVRLIVEHLPVRSITKIRPSPFAIGPWKQKIVTIGERELSLDDIEHGILRKDWDEPRVHYALNCASYSCPNLRQQAWVAATLDADLDAAAHDYINNPRAVKIRRDGRLVVSSIYKWYQSDFGDSKAGVIQHLLHYADPDLTAQITAKPDIADYAYDWSLNDVGGNTGGSK